MSSAMRHFHVNAVQRADGLIGIAARPEKGVVIRIDDQRRNANCRKEVDAAIRRPIVIGRGIAVHGRGIATVKRAQIAQIIEPLDVDNPGRAAAFLRTFLRRCRMNRRR